MSSQDLNVLEITLIQINNLTIARMLHAIYKLLTIFLVILKAPNTRGSQPSVIEDGNQRTKEGFLVARNPDDQKFGHRCQTEANCPASIRTPTSLITFPCNSLSGFQSGKGKARCDRIEKFNDLFYKTGVIPKSLTCSSVINCTFYGNEVFASEDTEITDKGILSWACQNGRCRLQKRTFDKSRAPFELLNEDQMRNEIQHQLKKNCHWRQESVKTMTDLSDLIGILTQGVEPTVEFQSHVAHSTMTHEEAEAAKERLHEQLGQCSAAPLEPIPEEEEIETAVKEIEPVITVSGASSSQSLLVTTNSRVENTQHQGRTLESWSRLFHRLINKPFVLDSHWRMKKINPLDVYGALCEETCPEVITPTLTLSFPCKPDEDRQGTAEIKPLVRTCHFPEIRVNHWLFDNNLVPHRIVCDFTAQCHGRLLLDRRIAYFGHKINRHIWACSLGECMIVDCRRAPMKVFEYFAHDRMVYFIKEAVKFFTNWDRSVKDMMDIKDILMEYYTLNSYFKDQQLITFTDLRSFLFNHRIDKYSRKLTWLHKLERAENERRIHKSPY